jgi:hypothetical protein
VLKCGLQRRKSFRSSEFLKKEDKPQVPLALNPLFVDIFAAGPPPVWVRVAEVEIA